MNEKGKIMRRVMLLVLLLVASGFVAVVKTTGQDGDGSDSAAGERWEYLVVGGASSTNLMSSGNPRMRKEMAGTFGREAFVLEQHMDRLGARGWELVSVAGNPADPVYYFKRRK